MTDLVALWNNGWILTFILVLGFVVLIKGADWLVVGASALAKRFGISDLVIGLTVVAFGTSMPEFVVNMVSVADGDTDLAITNILGSNIINTFVILGLTALIYPIVSNVSKFDLVMSALAGVLVLILTVYHSPFDETEDGIGRLGGLLLLVLFVIFLSTTMLHAKQNSDYEQNAIEIKQLSVIKTIFLIVIGLLFLVLGGEMIVKSAVKIATNLGVSEAIIGLTIVALGTSLPELATSVVAAMKKNCDIALGNVVGSNIFNVFFVLGASATIHSLPAYIGIELDAMIAALGSVLVLIFVFTNRKHEIKRWAGILLLLIYIIYLAYRIINLH